MISFPLLHTIFVSQNSIIRYRFINLKFKFKQEYLWFYMSTKNGSVFKTIPEIHRKEIIRMELLNWRVSLSYKSKSKRNFFLGHPVQKWMIIWSYTPCCPSRSHCSCNQMSRILQPGPGRWRWRWWWGPGPCQSHTCFLSECLLKTVSVSDLLSTFYLCLPDSLLRMMAMIASQYSSVVSLSSHNGTLWQS